MRVLVISLIASFVALTVSASDGVIVRASVPPGTIQTIAGGGVGDGYPATAAGTGNCGFSGDGGAAISAALNYSYGLAVDGTGNLYIADEANCRVREVSGGIITTVAGTGNCSFSGDGGPASSAALNGPWDV